MSPQTSELLSNFFLHFVTSGLAFHIVSQMISVVIGPTLDQQNYIEELGLSHFCGPGHHSNKTEFIEWKQNFRCVYLS